jgi:regulatory protein
MLYNKWGQRKIEQALFMKKIGKDVSTPIFEEIPDEDWIEVLKPMIEQKLKTTKGKNDYERSIKTIRWALGRGFLMEHIRNCIHTIEIEEEDEGL